MWLFKGSSSISSSDDNDSDNDKRSLFSYILGLAV